MNKFKSCFSGESAYSSSRKTTNGEGQGTFSSDATIRTIRENKMTQQNLEHCEVYRRMTVW